MLPAPNNRQAAPQRSGRDPLATAAPGPLPRLAARRVRQRALLGLALGAALTACGQVGPLYQPPAESQQESSDPAAP